MAGTLEVRKRRVAT